MILPPLFGAALIVAVATGPSTGPAGEASLSAQQKIAATQPLVRSATECIVRAVIAVRATATTVGPHLAI